MGSSFIDRVINIVGDNNCITNADNMIPFLREPRGIFQNNALAVVMPNSSADVAEIVRCALDFGVIIIPQGGNTGLVGGQVPDSLGHHQCIISMKNTNKIVEVNSINNTITTEAGVLLSNVHKVAKKYNRLFPLTIASEDICTIGGNIASNAGGNTVLSYGNTRELVLGLEVVLPDGRIWSDLNKLRKNNAGYDLKQLFIGSEGTLGIITAAVLKLYPEHRSSATAIICMNNLDKINDLIYLMQSEFGSMLTSFELLPRFAFDLAAKYDIQFQDYLFSNWYIILELSSPVILSLNEILSDKLFLAKNKCILNDAIVAKSSADRERFWHVRLNMSAIQLHAGASIKHDVSVPIESIAKLITEGCKIASSLIPGIRPMPFGHIGDGNIHFNFSQPYDMAKEDFLAQRDALNSLIYDLVINLGGSISAEHGIGQLKKNLLVNTQEKVFIDLMHNIKKTIDPKGIMNSGKVI